MIHVVTSENHSLNFKHFCFFPYTKHISKQCFLLWNVNASICWQYCWVLFGSHTWQMVRGGEGGREKERGKGWGGGRVDFEEGKKAFNIMRNANLKYQSESCTDERVSNTYVFIFFFCFLADERCSMDKIYPPPPAP